MAEVARDYWRINVSQFDHIRLKRMLLFSSLAEKPFGKPKPISPSDERSIAFQIV
jgi:hypothetical protein